VRTRLAFQYLAPGSTKPDDTTIAEVFQELSSEDHVPNVGDIITMLPKPPSEGLTNFRSLKVVTRHFIYAYGGQGLDRLVDCQIFLIVTEPDEDDITSIAE
jgi:hypothetical protein